MRVVPILIKNTVPLFSTHFTPKETRKTPKNGQKCHSFDHHHGTCLFHFAGVLITIWALFVSFCGDFDHHLGAVIPGTCQNESCIIQGIVIIPGTCQNESCIYLITPAKRDRESGSRDFFILETPCHLPNTPFAQKTLLFVQPFCSRKYPNCGQFLQNATTLCLPGFHFCIFLTLLTSYRKTMFT